MTRGQQKHTILIVEDEDVLRNAYVSVFTFEKFNVDAAPNGQVALEKVATLKPQVIILDILMPVMSGIEFLQQVKIAETYPDTRVLVLSNLSDKETIARVIELGATRHLIKSSVSPRELVANVRELLTV